MKWKRWAIVAMVAVNLSLLGMLAARMRTPAVKAQVGGGGHFLFAAGNTGQYAVLWVLDADKGMLSGVLTSESDPKFQAFTQATSIAQAIRRIRARQ
ncbi:MAG: hypothetical protein HKL96_09510 [Phycisphaerales bacterium]|nr:hypothetical protein [Phycisphaerales bacterium]